MAKKQTIHLLGGARGIGRWFMEKALLPRADRYTIHCYDYDGKRLAALPEAVRCPLDEQTHFAPYREQFAPGDWVLFAVPLNTLKQALEAVAQVAREASLFVSLTSVQKIAGALFDDLPEAARARATLIGCHPLFGDSLPSPVGQTVVLTRCDDALPQQRAFRDFLSDIGFLAVELDEEEHDRYMAIIQGLTHFACLAFARSIADAAPAPARLLDFKTPNFQFLYAFASRILKIAPTTTGAIQSADHAAAARRQFIDAAQTLHRALEAAGSAAGCAEVIEELRAPLAGNEVAEGVEIAALAVDSLQRIEERFHRYKQSGAPFVFQSKTGETMHIVRIVSIQPDSITYEESKKAIREGDRTLYAFGMSEIARANYRTLGYNLPRARRATIKKRNVRTLEAEALSAFYRDQIKPIPHRFSVSNPHKLGEIYFEQWLPALVRGVWRCEFIEAYRRRNAAESVVLRILFNPNLSRDEIVGNIVEAVESAALKRPPNWVVTEF